MLKTYNHAQVNELLPFDKLIKQMDSLFKQRVTCPERVNLTIPNTLAEDGQDNSLLMMPAWHGDIGCVKLVNVNPDNGAKNLPAISATMLVFDRHTGQHLAVLDGDAVTIRRTTACSALACDYLAPKDAEHLLVVGAGAIASQLPEAFNTVRPLKTVTIWNRGTHNAEKLAKKWQQANPSYQIKVSENLADAVNHADIISTATLAQQPILFGDMLREVAQGKRQHIDLIGSFKPTMQEADDSILAHAKGAIFMDSPFVKIESGDIALPLAKGTITDADIAGDLADLCNGTQASKEASITLFKGAGNAVMDLSAAMLAVTEMPR